MRLCRAPPGPPVWVQEVTKTGKVTWSRLSLKSPLPSQQIEKSSCLELFPFLPMAERRRLMRGVQ